MLNLISKIKLMRKGSEFAKQFEGMTADQINKILEDKQNKYNEKTRGMSETELIEFHRTNPDNAVKDEYGLIEYERNKILSYLLAEAKAKQLVDQIPPKAFAETKNKFNSIRHILLIERYNTPQEEIRSVIKSVLGNRDSKISWRDEEYLNIVDIAEAFEAREKELQKSAKGRWWDNVKKLFSRLGKGKKALPEPVAEETMGKKAQDIRKNIVPSEGKGPYQEHAAEVAAKFNQDSPINDISTPTNDRGADPDEEIEFV